MSDERCVRCDGEGVRDPRPESRVRVAPDAEEIGLAHMLADLVRQNLEAHPERVRALERLRLRVGIRARDAEVELTLAFGGGVMEVRGGIGSDVDLEIDASADAILALPLIRTGPLGLPAFWEPPALDVLRRAMRGELRLRPRSLAAMPGMLPQLGALAELLSAAESGR
ncbi:MAG: hypothetical protein QME96_07665 [Myxococcota bacterium]|nr:hypothetical protein [Myxococcota bacterium]